MKIAIDYDLTYTVDPGFWDAVVKLGRKRGHEFVCITARSEPPSVDRGEIVPKLPIVLSPRGYKQDAAKAAGHRIDVWIDDTPGLIQPDPIAALMGAI